MSDEGLIKITQGSTAIFSVRLVSARSKQAIDLTNATNVALKIPGKTGSVELTVAASEITVTSPATGLLSVKAPGVKTSLLKAGSRQDFDIHYTIDSDPYIVKVEHKLQVKEPAVSA